MKAAAAVIVLLGIGAADPADAAAQRKNALNCSAFMDAFAKAAGPVHKATFERPLNITRGFDGDEPGVDVRVLSTGEDVEGTLKCKGDEFRRFEVRIETPASAKVVADFKDYEEATLAAAFGWDKAKVQTVASAMSSDADEYMRASIQRGDTYVSGKVEYHHGDALDLGVIWTEADRTLIVISQDEG